MEDLDERFERDGAVAFDERTSAYIDQSHVERNVTGRVARHLTVTLNSEEPVLLRWSPALHALLHYEITGIFGTLAPFFRSRRSKDPVSAMASKNLAYRANGDHVNVTSNEGSAYSASMRGDARSAQQQAKKVLELRISLTPLDVQLNVTDKKCVKLCMSALRYCV